MISTPGLFIISYMNIPYFSASPATSWMWHCCCWLCWPWRAGGEEGLAGGRGSGRDRLQRLWGGPWHWAVLCGQGGDSDHHQEGPDPGVHTQEHRAVPLHITQFTPTQEEACTETFEKSITFKQQAFNETVRKCYKPHEKVCNGHREELCETITINW